MRGADKLLQPLGDGAPLLRVVAERALATGWPVRVTLPPGAVERRRALDGLDVTLLEVPDAATGMSASFRALAACGAVSLLVVLADMPEITTEDMTALIAAHRAAPDRVIRATDADGRAGQPVLFPARLVPAMGELGGDTGARAILKGEEIVSVTLPGRHATTDLDTPEDWATWRARTGL